VPYRWTAERMAYWARTLKFYELAPRQLNAVRTKLLVAQHYLCGVCGQNLSGRIAYLDHDHHTGELRGMCCYSCNRFRVARNTTDTALEVVRYLADPPARALLPKILEELK
jgi:hypothetical protein